MRTAYITHPDCMKHEMGSFHPESPSRLSAIEDQLITQRLMDLLRPYDAPLVTDEQLQRIHDPDYIAEIKAMAPSEGHVMLDGDTQMNPYTLVAAQRAAGSVILATDLVMGNEMENAFCAIRPPGHHAERSKAMGFCIFNNIAVGVAHALEHHSLERVAIVDFDVHHGNGTEDIFRDEARVLMLSTFQHPFYPFTDAPLSDTPPVIHLPIDAAGGSQTFRKIVNERLLPALDAFAPQMIYISAGFDAHHDDDMAQLNLSDLDYGWVTERLMETAQRHCEGRIVSVLEGGYSLPALGRSAALHVKSLLGIH